MADIQTYLYGKKFPNRIFVGGLPVDTRATELAQFFEYFGHVTESKIILDDNGVSKGYGFVTFQNQSSVRKVDSMGIIYFKNKKINIGPAVKKESPNIQPELIVLPSHMPMQTQQANTMMPGAYYPAYTPYQQPTQQIAQQQSPQVYMDTNVYYQVTNDGVYYLYPASYPMVNQHSPYSPLRAYRSGSVSSLSSDDEIKPPKRYTKRRDVPPRFLRK